MTGWVPGDAHARAPVSLRMLLLGEGATGPEAALVVLGDSLQVLAGGSGHGDYKPENVFVSQTGAVTLADADGAVDRQRLSSSTPFYLAPELWGSGAPDPHGDVYAATVTFFECVVGAPPFYADDPTALRRHHEAGRPPVEAAPEPVRDLMRRGMARDPAARPTARDFLAEVDAAAIAGYGGGWEERGRDELIRLAFAPPQAFPGGDAPHRTIRRRRRPGRVAAAAGVALVLGVGMTGVALHGKAPGGPDVPAAAGGTDPPATATVVVPPGDPGPALAAAGRELADALARSVVVPAPASAPTETAAPLAPPPGIAAAPPTAPGLPTGSPELRAAPAPRTAVTTLSITSFARQGAGTRVLVSVDTTGTEAVLLGLRYGGGPQGSSGTTNVRNFLMTLSGNTSYSLTHDHDFAGTCTSHWSVVVATAPAAGNGPQSAEVAAIPCPTPAMETPAVVAPGPDPRPAWPAADRGTTAPAR
ncbi:MAG: protein kinase domain-containing protein [Pseudonocardiaceae bacterium]